MSELNIVVVLHAKKGREAELRKDLAALVPLSRKEKGNLGYELLVDQADPGRFVFVERWASLELRTKHHKSDGLQETPHGYAVDGGVPAIPVPRCLE